MSAALAVGLWLPAHISVTLTPSLGHRIFFLTEPDSRNFKQGDYLLFHKKVEEAKTDQLLKMVGCAPGHQLTVNHDDYYCDENYLGHALAQDSKDNKLPRFVFNGPVPAGNLFVVGSHPRSYDSRYFGFIHAESVFKKAYPLW